MTWLGIWKAILICSAYTTTPGFVVSSPVEEAMTTCMQVAIVADRANIDPVYATALAYTESRFRRTAVSSVGAQGPMQVLPQYHCPNGRLRGCDLVAAGVGALGRYMRRYGGWDGTRCGRVNWGEAFCHYNSGRNCYRRSRAFARTVQRRASQIAVPFGHCASPARSKSKSTRLLYTELR